MKSFVKKYKGVLILLGIIIVFFSSSLVLTYDSTHYLGYVDIFEKVKPFSSWDIVRGPVFPFILYLFDLFFGKNSFGMLLGMFIFYIVYCIVIYKFSTMIFKDCKHKGIWETLFCAFSFLNPIILGYYHTMLTEFVAITITTVTLLIAWKWWDAKNTKTKILCSLYFIIFTTISYFLKQPYICTVFVPMIISIVYAIVKNHSKKNILYYITTFLLSIVFLLISMVAWDKFLELKKVNTNSGRDSSSMLSKQLLNSIDAYKVKEISEYSNIKNDKYLTKQEKKEIKKELSKNDNVYIISIYDNKKLLEKDYLKVTKNDYPSGKDTVIEIISTFFRYPKVILEIHAKNYCALSSVCVIESEDGVMYHVTNKVDVLHSFENNVIPLKSFRNEEKIFDYPEERYETVKNYIVPKNQGLISKVIAKTAIPTTLVFEFVILTVGLFLIGLVTIRIKKRKKLKEYNTYLLSFMMLSFSFSTLMINDWVGSIIDRYAVICFIPGLIGIIGTILFIKNNVGSK
jgi:hypothetical protein